MVPSIVKRPSASRGSADHGWLQSKFTFSFAEYYDPKFNNFGALRVLNDDTVASGGGFPPHPHRDAEIFSYILSGSLAHKDSMGHSEVLSRGHVQFTSAGTGITHSEFNGESGRTGAPVRFLQVWVTPRARGLRPSYQTGSFPEALKRNTLLQFLAPAPAAGSADAPPRQPEEGAPLQINSDFRAFASILAGGAAVEHTLSLPGAPPRQCYVHVPIMPGSAGVVLSAEGAASVELAPGDGAFVSNARTLRAVGQGASLTEFVLFDMAAE
jgi:hypothetical protein